MPLLEQVLEQYPKDVRLVFKNFPLSSHKFARKAAIAAMAAHKQGKFWEFHDGVFANYNQLNDEKIVQIAEEVGLDVERFKADQNDAQVVAKVTRDARDGQKAAVRGTPSIFVNGKQLKNRSLDGFRQVIDGELKKTKQNTQ